MVLSAKSLYDTHALFGGVFFSSHCYLQGIIPASVKWGGQANQVFSYLAGAFMQPAYTLIDNLLARDLEVVVYSGQEDIIVNVMCTLSWFNELTWPRTLVFSLCCTFC